MPTIEEVIPSRTKEFFTRLKDIPFDSRATDGDSGNAWFCAEASALAYKAPAFIHSYSTESLERLGWTATTYEAESTQAVLLLNDEVAVLAFRGTRVSGFFDLLREAPINFRDLATDFSAALLRTENGEHVHTGFYTAFKTFWNACGEAINSKINSRPVHLTGHSLGGALATIAARQLAGSQGDLNLGTIRSLYTFGSPTVGDDAFRKGFDSLGVPVFRFVHGYDLVTTVAPPELRYAHVGDIIHIDESDTGTLSRRKQHTLLDSLHYNVRHTPAGFLKTVRQLGNIFSRHLPSVTLPKDALVEHAPINYCLKLRNPDPSRRLPV